LIRAFDEVVILSEAGRGQRPAQSKDLRLLFGKRASAFNPADNQISFSKLSPDTLNPGSTIFPRKYLWSQ
jgi:hypothetical protein